MRITTDADAKPRSLGQRLAWFVALWAGGVLAIAAVAGVLHWVLKV